MSHFETFYEGARVEPRVLRAEPISQLELRYHLARGRELQSLAFRTYAVRAFRGLGRGLRWATGLALAPGRRSISGPRAA